MNTKTFIIFAIFSNMMASVFLKMASAYIPEKLSFINLKGFLFAGGALAFYATSFLLYAFVLRGMPVSKAYLYITFGSQISLLVVGAFLFSERYEPIAWLGIFLVLLGVILVGISGGK